MKEDLQKALHSRRFWLAVVAAALVVANQGLGLNLDPTTVTAFAGIVISAVLGDSLVHAAAVHKAATESKPAPQSKAS